jgi:hypothetical protein
MIEINCWQLLLWVEIDCCVVNAATSAALPPPLPLYHCRCRAAAVTVLPPLPLLCRRHCRCPAAPLPAAAKLPLPHPTPLLRCRRSSRAGNAFATLRAIAAPLPRCLHRSADAATTLPPLTLRCRCRLYAAHFRHTVAVLLLLTLPPRCQRRHRAANAATALPTPPPCCRRRHRSAATCASPLPLC